MTDKTNRRVAIIDANVLMGGGTSCFHELKDTDIVIPAMVLSVLESHMSEDSYACGAVIRYIEKLRKQNASKLTGDGITIANGNTVRVRWTDANVVDGQHSRQFIGAAETIRNNDGLNRSDVVVISNSANVRLMANHKGFKAEAYQGAALLFNGEFNFYREMSDADILRRITQECVDAGISTPHNAVIKFVASNGDEYGAKLKKGDQLTELPYSVHAGSLRPKNTTQAIAMAYAMDTQLTAVMFSGTAGAGKSMIALAAAISQVDAGLYDQIIVFRSMVEVEGQKLGFLPGSVDEKMDGTMSNRSTRSMALLKPRKAPTAKTLGRRPTVRRRRRRDSLTTKILNQHPQVIHRRLNIRSASSRSATCVGERSTAPSSSLTTPSRSRGQHY